MRRTADILRRRPGLAAAGVMGLLTILFWWPALFGGLAALEGDASCHGLPLMQRLADGIWRGRALTWAGGIYGGHPVFAESQGGFAHPLNLLFAVFVTPLIGTLASVTWFHAATMLIGACGMVAVARQLGLGVSASLFAATATAFAPGFTSQQHNLTMSDSLAAIPWVLFATELWIARPSRWRGAALGVGFALVVLAGP